MRRKLALFCVFILLLCSNDLMAQKLSPMTPVESDLITPVNAQPLSIETVSKRRGISVDSPARNLIIFSTSGFTGASAAFRDAFTNSYRDTIRWQGFQLIFPVWADRHKSARNSIISTMTHIGKKLAMVSDEDFLLPGILDGANHARMPDLTSFSVAISLSDKMTTPERVELMKDVNAGQTAATDLPTLEKVFTSRAPVITACLPNSQVIRPGFAELVSAVVNRTSLAPEGFCALINLSSIAKHRENNNFIQMLASMRIRETVLKQLETLIANRKDTLLLIIDEPERGYWQAGENFAAEDFINALKKIAAMQPSLESPECNVSKLLDENFPGLNFPVDEISKTVKNREPGKALDLIEKTINKNFAVNFTSFQPQGTYAGYTVLAQGQNADLFFGISSFPEFFRRLGLAMGVSPKEK